MFLCVKIKYSRRGIPIHVTIPRTIPVYMDRLQASVTWIDATVFIILDQFVLQVLEYGTEKLALPTVRQTQRSSQ